MASPGIIIIGAGLSGLSLARCLKAKGVSVVILEKMSCTPRFNYGIILQSWAYQPLLKLLQLDDKIFRRKLTSYSERDGTGNMSTSISSKSEVSCHRGKLEELLREGLDIRWEHAFTGIEIEERSPITQSVYLQNGESLRARLVIGADGVHSQVRMSSAPNLQPKILPYVVFNGKRNITLEHYKQRIEPLMHGQTRLESRQGDVVLSVSINDYSANGVTVGYTYSRPVREKDTLHKPDRPINGASSIPEDFYIELDELDGLKPLFTDIFNPSTAREDRIIHWLMRTILVPLGELQSLADRGVVLIGDAVHAMPILGGEGASYAIKDGLELAELVTSPDPASFKNFIEQRYEMWRNGVQESEKSLLKIHFPTEASL